MKTTTTTKTRRSQPRTKRPARLDSPSSCFLATTSRAMLSFLARLSGRRRRWRHVRDRSPTTSGSASIRPGAAAAGGDGACSPTYSRQTQQQQQQQQQQFAISSMAETGESTATATTTTTTTTTSYCCCARCRAHSSCSCELLGLNAQQQQPSSTATAEPLVHCRRSSRYRRSSDARQMDDDEPANVRKDESCYSRNVLLRRRPPESSSPPRPATVRRSSSSTATSSRSWRTSYLAATLLLLSTGLISYAEACSSRSTPKPRPPTPTPRPNITFHMYTCPPDYAEWYCLNGATCFTVKIVDSLLYNCLCANGYIGQRCEFKDLDGSYLPSRQRIMLETASIAGAVTIAVFLAVITFISVYIHCKRKQKELRMMSNGTGVDVVDGPPRDPELRPFCSRSRSLMIFMAKNPNSTTPSIEQTRMPNWNYPPSCPAEASTRMANINESKRPSQ